MQQAQTYEALQDYHTHQKWRETGEHRKCSLYYEHMFGEWTGVDEVASQAPS